MKKLMFFLILLLILGVSSMAAILVEPSRFILQIEPGKKETGAITIINTGDTPANLAAILYDWDISSDGKLNETVAGTRTDTLNGLIKFNPRQFTINPGQSQIVRFTIEAPKDNIEHKGIVFFEETIASGGEVGTLITTKIGATIYAAPKGVKLSLQFQDITVTSKNDEVSLNIKAVNNGNAHLRMTVIYQLQNKAGKKLKDGSLSEQVLLCAKDATFSLPIANNLPSGDYRLILDIAFYGVESRLNRAIEFSIP